MAENLNRRDFLRGGVATGLAAAVAPGFVGCSSLKMELPREFLAGLDTPENVYAYVRDNFFSTGEARKYAQSPSATLQRGGGNCADLAIFGAHCLDESAFTAEVFTVMFGPEYRKGHSVTVFEDEGKWGYIEYSAQTPEGVKPCPHHRPGVYRGLETRWDVARDIVDLHKKKSARLWSLPWGAHLFYWGDIPHQKTLITNPFFQRRKPVKKGKRTGKDHA